MDINLYINYILQQETEFWKSDFHVNNARGLPGKWKTSKSLWQPIYDWKLRAYAYRAVQKKSENKCSRVIH